LNLSPNNRFIVNWDDLVFDNDFLKARARMFASRSEAGRYAAHIRWANNRGQQPLTVEQWRAQGGMTEPQGGTPQADESSLESQLAPLIAEAQTAMRLVNEIEEKRLVDEIGKTIFIRLDEYNRATAEEQAQARMVINAQRPPDSLEWHRGSTINGAEWNEATAQQRTEMYLKASQEALKTNPPTNFIKIEEYGDLKAQMVPAQHLVDAMEKVTAVGRVGEQHIASKMEDAVKANKGAYDKALDDLMVASAKRDQAQTAHRYGLKKYAADKRQLQIDLLDQAWKQGLPRRGFNKKDHPLNPQYSATMKVLNAEKKRLEKELKSAQDEFRQKMDISKATGVVEANQKIVDDVLKIGGTGNTKIALAVPSEKTYSALIKDTFNAVVRRLPDGVTKTLTRLGNLSHEQIEDGGAFNFDGGIAAGFVRTGATIFTMDRNSPFRMSVASVFSHELTHGLEYASPTVHSLVGAFRESRLYSYEPTITTRSGIPEGIVGHVVHSGVRPFSERVGIIQSRLGHDNSVQDLGGAFSLPDKFGDPYAGRVYGINVFAINSKLSSRPDDRRHSNEQLTTGVQALLYGNQSSKRFGNTDSEHISFALGVLLTTGDI
jgi:hypothetical protein